MATEQLKIHFIGIGGAGISALARMARAAGHSVTGSNMEANDTTSALVAEGIKVFVPHSSKAITTDLDLLVKSSAATKQTPAKVEIEAAEAMNIAVEHREYLINKFAQSQKSIGVAGTHGKTTTTSMVAHALISLNSDPSYLIGGILQSTGTNAELGRGDYFVWEADEFNNHYHGVTQNYAIINNIEFDHPDIFKSEEEYLDSFRKFVLENVKDKLILNLDDDNITKLIEEEDTIAPKTVTFGQKDQADYRMYKITQNPAGITVGIEFEFNKRQEVYANLYGKHNAYNLTAAFALLHSLGFASESIAQALSTFQGSGRRFELIYDRNNLTIISDYAHHPTAIKTTVAAARAAYPNAKLVAVLEPHQYQRVAALLPLYKDIFTTADEVILLPIYASRDQDITITSTEELLNIVEHSVKNIYTYPQLASRIQEELSHSHTEPVVYLCMSAGKLDEVIRESAKIL